MVVVPDAENDVLVDVPRRQLAVQDAEDFLSENEAIPEPVPLLVELEDYAGRRLKLDDDFEMFGLLEQGERCRSNLAFDGTDLGRCHGRTTTS